MAKKGQIKDLTGMIFERLTVISFNRRENGKTYWNCRCSCGKEKVIVGGCLGRSTLSCGCYKKEQLHKLIVDLTNQKFGKLTVIGLAEKPPNIKNGHAFWWCKCDCGKIKKLCSKDLRGGTLSCGCYLKERVSLPIYQSSMNLLYGSYFGAARKRNLSFNISKEQFLNLTQQNCFYCGIKPSLECKCGRGVNGNYIYNGVDRIDNSRGYEIDNIVTCCATCNYAKKTMPQDEFYNWIKRVYNHCILPQIEI